MARGVVSGVARQLRAQSYGKTSMLDANARARARATRGGRAPTGRAAGDDDADERDRADEVEE